MSEPDYAEFDDVKRDGPFASSEKARAEIGRLKAQYRLGFHQDPGGGELSGSVNGKPFQCRLGLNNDIEDLGDFRLALDRATVT